jgi:hypothetical protein
MPVSNFKPLTLKSLFYFSNLKHDALVQRLQDFKEYAVLGKEVISSKILSFWFLLMNMVLFFFLTPNVVVFTGAHNPLLIITTTV